MQVVGTGRARFKQHFGTRIEQFCAFYRPAATQIGLQVAILGDADAGAADAGLCLDQIVTTMHPERAFYLQNDFRAAVFHAVRFFQP